MKKNTKIRILAEYIVDLVKIRLLKFNLNSLRVNNTKIKGK